MKKGMKQVANAMAKLHEFYGDEYLAQVRCIGFRKTCPVIAWQTQVRDGKPETEATLLWDEPMEPETVKGCPPDLLVFEVCTRVMRRLRSVSMN